MELFFREKFFWLLLILTVIGEFFIPWVLKRYYPGYRSRSMVMSVLGSPSSPVRRVYNGWLVWLGCFLTVTAVAFYRLTRETSAVLAWLTLLSVLIFAVGAGILAGLFSVNETKEMTTTAAKIHGIGSSIGFMTLLFLPLLCALVGFQKKDSVYGGVCLTAFVLGLVFFALFIMGDKEPVPRYHDC